MSSLKGDGRFASSLRKPFDEEESVNEAKAGGGDADSDGEGGVDLKATVALNQDALAALLEEVKQARTQTMSSFDESAAPALPEIPSAEPAAEIPWIPFSRSGRIGPKAKP